MFLIRFFCSDELIKSVDVSECSFSDHCLIKTETYILVDPITIQAKCINPSLTSFEKFDFNRSDWINLSQSLKFTNGIHELDQVSGDEILPVAMNILISTCSIHVPLKHPKEARKSKFQKKRRVLMRKRTKLSRIILCTPQIISQLLSIEEQISSSHLKEKIHEEHVAVSKIKVDPKHFFRYAKRLNPLNNTLTDNKYEMCCLLVNQFNSVFTKPKQTSVIKDPVTFFFSHTTREDDLFLTYITLSDSIIIEAIKELSPNSAGGPDGIPASLLINCAKEIAPALKIFFSHSLSSSLIPTSFKEAAIIPVFKSGDKNLPSNYRPVSLISVLSKVIEKIFRKQVLTFISHRGYLNNTQHGFRSGRSCMSALFDVYDNIMHMINNQSTVDMIYLDFSKAFDKVDHGILLHKLRDLGIRDRLGLWFFHFLNNRQHYVRMPDGISQPHPVLSGVPQGTVLGPLLFLIMISGIDKGSKLVSFADATRVYSCINDIEKCDQLQIDLNSVYDWAYVNNMFLNTQEFNYVSFNGSMTPYGSNVYTNPNMEIISPSMHVLDLGIYMSGDCTFIYHISSCLKSVLICQGGL